MQGENPAVRLKQASLISNVNKEYIQTRSNGKIRVEMDAMWVFYHDKEHQICKISSPLAIKQVSVTLEVLKGAGFAVRLDQ